MFASFCESHTPNGEIIFLAADPECEIKGVGSALLSAFEKEEKGKLIYLYTDSACGAFEFIEKMKTQVKTKEIGFSFQADPELLDQILTKYPNVDYVLLQVNYVDWDSKSIQSRKCCDVAEKR